MSYGSSCSVRRSPERIKNTLNFISRERPIKQLDIGSLSQLCLTRSDKAYKAYLVIISDLVRKNWRLENDSFRRKILFAG